MIEGLERLMKGRTVITIAHRLDTIRDADKIIVLQDGVVAEQGTHDPLLARNGIYADLYRIRSESGDHAGTPAGGPKPDMSRSLIVLPDDTAKPILAAIDGAAQTLRIKMFVFSDPALLKAVIAAKQRGVKVRVMLNPARRSGEDENDATRKALERAGIEVQDSNPAFDLTHEKSMVVDDATAFVKSLNWETRNLTETRDYAVVTTHGHDVAEIVECFDADWHRRPSSPRHESSPHLVPRTRPRAHRHFIDEAQAHAVRAERALPGRGDHRAPGARGAARREGARHGAPAAHAQGGEAHRGRRRPAHHGRRRHQGPQAQGPAAARQDAARRRRARDRRLDQPRARQLRRAARARHRGADDDVVERLHKVAKHDWEHSHALDLSDEGLMADLAGRIEGGAQLLAIDGEADDTE